MGISASKVSIDYCKCDSLNVITSYVKSRALTKFLYDLDNKYTVYSDSLFLTTKYLKDIDQGNYSEDRIITYNREGKKANQFDTHNPSRNGEYDITSGTRDFFSMLFYIRKLKGELTGSADLDGSGTIWETHFEQLGEEKISSCLGKINAIKVKFSFKKISEQIRPRSDLVTNNLFKEDNILYFWFSADERRIPLKAEFDRKPFSVYWRLINYEE